MQEYYSADKGRWCISVFGLSFSTGEGRISASFRGIKDFSARVIYSMA